MSTLPTNAQKRKAIPVATGFVDYFPDAMAAVAELSRVGNDQHNPGKPLHWDRSKSGDESDALMRHFLERGTIDTDGIRHSAKVAWRAMAMLQKELEDAYEENQQEWDAVLNAMPPPEPAQLLAGGVSLSDIDMDRLVEYKVGDEHPTHNTCGDNAVVRMHPDPNDEPGGC